MSSMSENLAVHSFSTTENPTGLSLENRTRHQELHKVENCKISEDDPELDRSTELPGRVDGPCNLRNFSNGTVDHGHREDQVSHLNHCDSQETCLNGQNRNIKSAMVSDNLYLNVNEAENQLPNINREGESCHSEAEWLEHDEPKALWIKWRGKWQSGIRCSRIDCPRLTLKAQPPNDQKKYFLLFCPHTRNYSWADVGLVRPIHEFPEPIAHRTHFQGLEKVKDVTLPRRFIMQKLAVDMVNIIDRLHNEAVSESARQVTVWKEFAMEASHCRDYSDLGKMLLKLQSMILEHYVDPDWLQISYGSWGHRCKNAKSAESVEVLKEELVNFVLWNKVEALWDAPVQSELSSEWKTWKKEAMKWFPISHPMDSDRDMEHRVGEDSVTVGLQISRKRPKLEVRRAEMHVSQAEGSISHEIQPRIDCVEVNSGFFGRDKLETTNTLASEPCIDKNLVGGAAKSSNHTSNILDKWDGLVVETATDEFGHTTTVEEASGDGGNVWKPLNPIHKFRRCVAFIEAKGRQCIRWASDGDDYCCVHLAIREKSPKVESTTPGDSPMCAGTTTHGTKCKHRSQHGSTFCKKHRVHSQNLMDIEKPLNVAVNSLKRSHSEMSCSTESVPFQARLLLGEVQNQDEHILHSAAEGEILDKRNILEENSETNVELLHCIGSSHQNNNDPCPDHPKFHTLYCEKHLPAFLKRARNGKSRIVTREIFLEFLRKCSSRKQKLHLHRACVVLYGFVKSVLSCRNPVSKETQLQWILSEASKDLSVGECLMNLVSCEREKLKKLWGFDIDNNNLVSSSVNVSVLQPEPIQIIHNTQINVKCKICSKEFSDVDLLGSHWMDVHKKEARWMFRGYACAICLDSFTNKKDLESHGREKHQVQILEQCLLLKCIPCGSHFVNSEQLWLHVLSVHSEDFKLCTASQQQNLSSAQSSQPLEPSNNQNCSKEGGPRRFICKFCGLKFDILPDLGRHHQAVHMGLNSTRPISSERGTHLNSYKFKSGRPSRPSFMKGLGASSYRIRNRGNIRMKKRFQASSPAITSNERIQIPVPEVVGLGRLAESQCSAVANSLFSEIQKAKPRPSNLDILSVARTTCCKINFQTSLEEHYGVLPERLYLKAAKLCSELNIKVEWHQEGFVCPKGCKPVTQSHNFIPLSPLPCSFVEHIPKPSEVPVKLEDLEMDEFHYIIDSSKLQSKLLKKAIVLCEDLSFGLESVPVNCVVDEDLVSSLRTALNDGSHSQMTVCPMPWDNFTYVTQRLLDASIGRDTESSHLGCACPHSTCFPDACDHVYLFDNDYENAKDIYGQAMQGRFPYDGEGKIILEEGYLVYECNPSCTCAVTCPNRVLQNGVQVKLEVFKTANKGWGVRAREAISRGTFVCEYIGEVLTDEATKRDKRYDNEGCSYLYKIEAHIDDMSELTEGMVSHVIDATRYGNVSRFINHSCSPNLVCYQVLVESMDSQLAHIGLYASRNIAEGEELAYNYRNKIHLSKGHLCYCNLPNCQGHIF